jgi:hypothetical protein
MVSPTFTKAASLSAAAIRYFPLGANSGHTGQTTFAVASQAMGGSGTLKNLYILLPNAPGVGTNFVFTVMKNGSATAMTVTISDTATAGSDTTNTVSYSPGDLLAMQVTPTNTPTSSAPLWSFDTTGSNQTIVTGDTATLGNAAATYLSLQQGVANTSAIAGSIIPTNGTINSLYVNSSVAPGAAKSWTATLVVNGTDTALTANFSGAATTVGSDTTHSVSVSAGDTAYWRIDPTGTPTVARVYVSAVFTPTIDGESIQTFSSPSTLVTTNSNQFSVTGGTSLTFGTQENARASYTGSDYVVRKFYGALSASAGTGKSRTFSIRTNGATTGVGFTITDPATTGNDTVNSGNLGTTPGLVSVNIVGSSASTAATAQWGFVTYMASTATNTGNMLLMF